MIDVRNLVLFNTLVQQQDTILDDVAPTRLVFLVKHIVRGLNPESLPPPIVIECLRALRGVLPKIQDVYGEFWEEILDIVVNNLKSGPGDPASIHANLRLIESLRTLTKNEDSNEDLQDAWAEIKGNVSQTLVDLLVRQSTTINDTHQPSQIVNSLLGRVVSKIVSVADCDASELFSAMASESPILQRAAYNILHEKIPSQQEQVTMDAALSTSYVAKLPEELLSLILETPDSEEYPNLKFERDVPAPYSRYLLSWKLVFDHWINASYKVQSDYVTGIKEGSYMKGLLDFTFKFLARGKDVKLSFNPSRFDIENYTPGEPPESDVQWIVCHLYCLTLKHLPLLAKAWWRNDCPRALEKPVEEWTEKHISPAVIRAELDTISTWDPNPDSSTSLEVKVHHRAREVVASYPIDDQEMSIRLSLSPTHPLQPISITAIKRVAANEKKWNAWLNTSNIVANFSSSSQGLGCVIDGLVAFRKNVAGELKGQSECAICYSIIDMERQLPTKRCGTCKNLFHGSCLFKWFRSSSSSGCPLCRNAFNYA